MASIFAGHRRSEGHRPLSGRYRGERSTIGSPALCRDGKYPHDAPAPALARPLSQSTKPCPRAVPPVLAVNPAIRHVAVPSLDTEPHDVPQSDKWWQFDRFVALKWRGLHQGTTPSIVSGGLHAVS